MSFYSTGQGKSSNAREFTLEKVLRTLNADVFPEELQLST